jgi:DegV family protein with EDD domain
LIRIVTDSSCDLPDTVARDHGISVVPLTIRFGDEEFVDRDELTVDAFWDRARTGSELAETAAPSVGRFLTTLQRLADDGASGAVIITLSSAISGTHSAAVLAADDAPLPVRVIDSRLVSGALGLAVLAAAEAAAQTDDLHAVERAAQDACDRGQLFAALDTLDHLRRGGRIGPAAAFFGSLLDVKPLITFVDGAVAAAGRVRTRTKAVAAVLDHVASLEGVQRIGIISSEPDPDPAIVTAVTEAGGREPLLMQIGPVVGSHAGPGVLGVAYLR